MTQQSPDCQFHFSKLFDRSTVISGGSTAIVERLACGHVRKSPFPDDTVSGRRASLLDIEREHDVYLRIANQPHILEMAEFSAEHGIVLQGMPNGTLREHLECQDSLVSNSQRLTWASDISEALHSLHTAGVVHADLKPENILLDEKSKVYLMDFSGSCLDGKQGSAWESARFFMPRGQDGDSTVETDLFALGSTLHEIMTGEQPYCDLQDGEVEERFQQGLFPEVTTITVGDIIRQCWEGKIHSAYEVYTALQGISSES
jgi:serine/threonine protein kinase